MDISNNLSNLIYVQLQKQFVSLSFEGLSSTQRTGYGVPQAQNFCTLFQWKVLVFGASIVVHKTF